MKRVWSISLMLILVLSQTFNSLVLMNYFVHQDFIINTKCENRTNPDSSCHGKCYLKKSLIDQSSPEEGKTTVRFLQESISSFCEFDIISSQEPEIDVQKAQKVWSETFTLLSGIENSIDRPPARI